MGITLTNIRTVIWDLDGTLLDSFGIFVDIMTQVLPAHGLPEPSFDQLRHNFHGNLEESMRGLVDEAVGEAELMAMLADFLRIDNEYIEDVDHHLFMDAVGLAKRAHEFGARQILVTNRAHGIDRGKASPRTMVQHSVLRPYIDIVICGDEVENRKPNPEVLGSLLAGLHSKSTLVVGDQVVDANFARNLEAQAVLVDRSGEGIAHLDRGSESIANGRVHITSSLAEVDLAYAAESGVTILQ